MAGSTIKQVIPVDLVASIRNSADISKKLRDELEDSLSSIDASSSLGKNLTKMLSDTTKKIVQLQAIAGKSFFSDKDLRSSLTLLDGITTKMSQIRTVVGGASASALGLDTAEIRAARNEIQRLQGEVKARRNQAVGTTSVGQDAALVKRLEATREKTGYDSGRSFSANIVNFQSAIARLNGEIVNLASTVTGSAEKVKNSQRELQIAQTDLGEQKTQYQQARAAYGDFSAASLLKEFGYKSYSGKKAKQQAAQRSSDLIQGLVKDGEFVEGGAEISEALGRWLKIDPAQLQGPAQDIVNNIVAAMQAAINNPESLKALKKNIADQQVGTKDGAAITSQYQTAKNQFEQAKTNVADATTNLQASQQQMQTDSTNLQNTKALLQEINDLLNILLAKRQEFDKDLGETYNAKLATARSQLKQAVEQAKQPQSQEITRIVEQQSRQQESTQRQADAHTAAVQNARDIEEQNKRMQAEQQQFSSQLNQSISRWMSVGQIIQYVKTGIREAWQDVQNLDKAMTNIAVVTDMSVGDLWGKINEYMSIAKEYGVTTQGVYEVSQLFFQQGLSANDVMAATTETLKMARVAGISYKDAADGMTVAIRAFRMEMEQASHVTDVYSKVAAVTASDTEELITAMSKTASSAEAVGSSFENTTAMLAVMIESTRESATNIGSAMKSIISR